MAGWWAEVLMNEDGCNNWLRKKAPVFAMIARKENCYLPYVDINQNSAYGIQIGIVQKKTN